MKKYNIVVVPKTMILFINLNAQKNYIISRCDIAFKSVLSSLQTLPDIVGKL